MQWLTLVPEDYGVQRLKADNLKPAVARALEPVSPYPSTHPVHLGKHPETQSRNSESRQPGERREGHDRRRKQVPVILDTRSKHDRRALQGRRSIHGEKTKTATPRQRIDVYT